jgi:hypothetical protein
MIAGRQIDKLLKFLYTAKSGLPRQGATGIPRTCIPMLEESTLIIEAWAHHEISAGKRVWIRRITSAAGRPLGFAQFAGDPNRTWWSFFRNVRLDVFETEDASHLLSITRRWGILGNWLIRDSEENHVGNLYARTIVTSVPAKIGLFDLEADGNVCVHDMQSRVIARVLTRTLNVHEIAFTSDLPANPFVRMLVFGSILTLSSEPITK